MKSPDSIPSSTEALKPTVEFRDLAELEEYLSWKQEVPEPIRKVVEGAMLGREGQIETDLPHTKEFLRVLQELFAHGKFVDDVSSDSLVRNLLDPLARIETQNGFINLFETMIDPQTSWLLKKRLYETQIKPAFDWIVERDVSLAMKKAEEELQKEKKKGDEKDKDKSEEEANIESEGKEEKHQVPPSSDESLSSMEAGGEKKEGVPKEYFTINPYYGGYAKSHIYERFDLNSLHFIPEKKELFSIGENDKNIEYDKTSTRVMYGLIRGGEPLAIPLYYNFVIDPSSLVTSTPEGGARFLKDKDGIWYLSVDKPGVWNYSFIIGKSLVELREENISDKEKEKNRKEEKEIENQGKLSDELVGKIKELKDQRTPPMKQARELVKFIKSQLTYSNDHDAWQKYVGTPDNFFTEIWKGKEADCHVANTLAFRALKEAGLTCRFVNGHYVKDKNDKGEAIMHSGSGHAWIEVWDSIGRKWLRMDATPSGDPTIDEGEQDKDLEDPKEEDEGDYGERDEIMDEKEVKKQIEKKKGESKKAKEKKVVNIEEAKFSSEAGCTEIQAREFLKDLERVRKIKNEKGESISDLLLDEWQKIVEERKVKKSEYRGPVRMDRGDILTDPVSAVIDLKSREFNPTGFEIRQTTEKIDYDFGGINVLFSLDLSGSMINPDSVSGRKKSDVQRDTALLFVDSLMQCAFLHRRESTETDLLPLKIMVTVASDHGQVKLPLTDRWGPKEQWQFYSALNQLASGGTPTHETLEYIRQAIEGENKILEEKRVSVNQKPINYVIETSDGAPDDLDETLSKHDELAKMKNTVVRAYVIGDVDINRPEYTKLSSFSVLAQAMADDIIDQFHKLKPKIG